MKLEKKKKTESDHGKYTSCSTFVMKRSGVLVMESLPLQEKKRHVMGTNLTVVTKAFSHNMDTTNHNVYKKLSIEIPPISEDRSNGNIHYNIEL